MSTWFHSDDCNQCVKISEDLCEEFSRQASLSTLRLRVLWATLTSFFIGISARTEFNSYVQGLDVQMALRKCSQSEGVGTRVQP